MRAARLHRYGTPDVLQIDEIATPEPGPDDLLIRVAAVSINPVDTKLRRGALRVVMRWSLPHTTGLDCVGTVEAVGSAVTGFSVGDRVYSAPNPAGEGVCADYAVIRASECAVAPSTLSDEQAASLPLVALTAYDCLVRHAQVKAGDKVLILGGAGGVGTIAIQLAKALGAEVATTASPRNTALVRSLGADHVVDYTQHDPADVLPQQDVVLVGVGGEGGNQAIRATGRGGRIAHIVGDLPAYVETYGSVLGTALAGANMGLFWLRARFLGRRAANIVKKSDGEALARITEWVEAGGIQPVIDTVFDFEQVAEAHAAVESGKCQGKVVVRVATGA